MKGQVTILVLLLGLMGLTVALSSASRSLSDLKQVSYVDFGTKAFAAAEAGLQYGLNAFSGNPVLADCTPHDITGLTINGINTSAGKFQYQICSNSQDNYDTRALSLATPVQDGVVSVFFPNNITPTPKGYRVYWMNPASVEIIIVNSAGSVTVSRYAYKGSGGYGSGFPTAATGASCGDGSYDNCADIGTYSNQDIGIRVKPIGSASHIKVQMYKNGGGQQPRIGNVTFTVSAWAETTNGTKKKVQAVQSPPTMPSIFDYVLFSNSSISK